MKPIQIALILSTAALLAGPVRAQDAPDATATPDAAADAKMIVHGSADVGYRWTNVTGSEAMYRRIFNLDQGARLMNFDLSGTAPKEANAFADAFGVSINGIGDPFSAAQFTMRKTQRYDVRVNWRQSKFDDTWPDTPAALGGLDTRVVVDRHAWTTKRQMANAGATFNATENLHLMFNYSRVSRTGTMVSTRTLDFVGSPSIWGTFARANPYSVTTPADESANRIVGGVSLNARNVTVIYQAGYQRFDETQNFGASSPNERSINIGDATTANELLATYGSAQSRKLSSPVSELSVIANPFSRLEYRGEYTYFRYRGPFSQTASYIGTARTDSGATILSPYNIAVNVTGEASAPSHVVDQIVTYRLHQSWNVGAEYRFARFNSESSGTLKNTVTGFAPATPSTTETDELSWEQTEQSVRLLLTFEPSPALTIRPAVRYLHRDISEREDGEINTGTTMKMRTWWPELTVGYKPCSAFDARGSLRTANSDTSYTRLSPVDRTIAHGSLRIQPTESLSIESTGDLTDSKLTAASFQSNLRGGSVYGTYKFSELFSAFAGLDYQSFIGKGSVSFLRGTAPIADDALLDEERDRIWLVGARIRPIEHLEVSASANFMRTTGTDTIAGEPALYGPMRFPYGTGSVSYEIPNAGRIILDVSRSHLYQDILSMNDFRGRLVTLRFSRDF